MFGITKEEVLNLAAEKVADMAITQEDGSVYAKAMEIVKGRIDKLFGEKINAAVEKALCEATEHILSETITPVDIWGERAGKSTTLRAALRDKACTFWTQKVNPDGVPCDSYGCKPRYEVVMGKFIKVEFDAVIKQNIVEVVGALKAAMRIDIGAKCNAVLDDIIRVKI